MKGFCTWCGQKIADNETEVLVDTAWPEGQWAGKEKMHAECAADFDKLPDGAVWNIFDNPRPSAPPPPPHIPECHFCNSEDVSKSDYRFLDFSVAGEDAYDYICSECLPGFLADSGQNSPQGELFGGKV